LAGGRALAAIDGLAVELIDRAAREQRLEDLVGAVRRAVVDADDLLGERRIANGVDDEIDRVALVVDRDEHGQANGATIERRSRAHGAQRAARAYGSQAHYCWTGVKTRPFASWSRSASSGAGSAAIWRAAASSESAATTATTSTRYAARMSRRAARLSATEGGRK